MRPFSSPPHPLVHSPEAHRQPQRHGDTRRSPPRPAPPARFTRAGQCPPSGGRELKSRSGTTHFHHHRRRRYDRHHGLLSRVGKMSKRRESPTRVARRFVANVHDRVSEAVLKSVCVDLVKSMGDKPSGRWALGETLNPAQWNNAANSKSQYN